MAARRPTPFGRRNIDYTFTSPSHDWAKEYFLERDNNLKKLIGLKKDLELDPHGEERDKRKAAFDTIANWTTLTSKDRISEPEATEFYKEVSGEETRNFFGFVMKRNSSLLNLLEEEDLMGLFQKPIRRIRIPGNDERSTLIDRLDVIEVELQEMEEDRNKYLETHLTGDTDFTKSFYGQSESRMGWLAKHRQNLLMEDFGFHLKKYGLKKFIREEYNFVRDAEENSKALQEQYAELQKQYKESFMKKLTEAERSASEPLGRNARADLMHAVMTNRRPGGNYKKRFEALEEQLEPYRQAQQVYAEYAGELAGYARRAIDKSEAPTEAA
jgi:hypothetical protein